MEMSRLTRDGTAEPVSRDQILRHARGQGNIHFSCSDDHEQDWQPYPVDPYSAIWDDHTYIRRETFSRRWSLRGLFSVCFNFKRLHSSSPPPPSKPVVEIDLPAATPPSTPYAEEGGNVGFFPGLSLPRECEGLVEGPCNQVGKSSKLSMMPR